MMTDVMLRKPLLQRYLRVSCRRLGRFALTLFPWSGSLRRSSVPNTYRGSAVVSVSERSSTATVQED